MSRKRNPNFGKIDYSALNRPPERHEYNTAELFANMGLDVIFIAPTSIKGARNPDFLMCDRIWEIKSPIKYSDTSFEKNTRKAMKQSGNIIFDLRRLSPNDEQKYIKGLCRRSGATAIKNLIVITGRGEVLTIKGKFARIRLGSPT